MPLGFGWMEAGVSIYSQGTEPRLERGEPEELREPDTCPQKSSPGVRFSLPSGCREGPAWQGALSHLPRDGPGVCAGEGAQKSMCTESPLRDGGSFYIHIPCGLGTWN